MKNNKIVSYENLTESEKIEFVEIFFEGFGHLFNLKKDIDKFKSLLCVSLHPINSYAYLSDNQVLGILLLATNKLRPLKLNEQVAIELFGKIKGVLMCRQINAIFQSKVVEKEKDLYIDVLGVSQKARKQGIGTELLRYAFSIEGFNTYFIEVLSKNINAKRLYKNIGFSEIKKNYFSPIRLLGYGFPIKMKKIKL